MTTDASARGRANRNRGSKAELDVAKWFRPNGFPQAERAVRTGYTTTTRTSADPGDLTGLGDVVVSIKDVDEDRARQPAVLAGWLAELDAMAAPAGAVRLLVAKRRGSADPGSWWCWMRLRTLAGLLAETAGRFDVELVAEPDAPVRMQLAAVVPLLRAAGHGDPLDAAA